MEIRVEIDFYRGSDRDKFWSGGRDTLIDIPYGKYGMLNELAEEVFSERVPTITEVNDWLWFDRDGILSYLGLEDSE